MDDLSHAFDKELRGKQCEPKRYQKFIDKRIAEARAKKIPIVLVGLNLRHDDDARYYDVHADKTYYIKLSTAEVVKQLYDREYKRHYTELFKDILKNKTTIYAKLLVRGGEKAVIKHYAGITAGLFKLSELRTQTHRWNKDYKRFGYTFSSRDKILAEVTALLRSKS